MISVVISTHLLQELHLHIKTQLCWHLPLLLGKQELKSGSYALQWVGTHSSSGETTICFYHPCRLYIGAVLQGHTKHSLTLGLKRVLSSTLRKSAGTRSEGRTALIS